MLEIRMDDERRVGVGAERGLDLLDCLGRRDRIGTPKVETQRTRDPIRALEEALQPTPMPGDHTREHAVSGGDQHNRATKAGKAAAINLTIYLNQKRIAVNEDKV